MSCQFLIFMYLVMLRGYCLFFKLISCIKLTLGIDFGLMEVNFRHLGVDGTLAVHFRTLGIEVNFRHLGVDLGTVVVHFRTLGIEKEMCINETFVSCFLYFFNCGGRRFWDSGSSFPDSGNRKREVYK